MTDGLSEEMFREPSSQPRLRVIPCSVMDANEFIEATHRHHGPVPTAPGGYRFCIAVTDDRLMVRGVATIGRPVAANRMTDGDFTAEVSRLATDGCPNACSALYGAAARACKALGYARVITYILDSETGVSLRAAGWKQDPGWFGGMTWTSHPRAGHDRHPLGLKGRWSRELNDVPPAPIWPRSGINTYQLTLDGDVA